MGKNITRIGNSFETGTKWKKKTLKSIYLAAIVYIQFINKQST